MTMEQQFPSGNMELTHILVVGNMEESKPFYRDILGAVIKREYGGNSCVLKFQGSWLLLVTGGKPSNSNRVSHAMTIRVPDCPKAYEILKSRGAVFLTPPVDRGAEIRCFFQNPDDHLFEISQAT